MNPVLMIAYNNLELTRSAVASALDQDIPVKLYVVNNGSTDGTRAWFDDLALVYSDVVPIHYQLNRSPLGIVNELLPMLLEPTGYCLGLPNDARIPRNCYSEMLKWPRGFVCASDNGQNEPIERSARPVSENTPMSVMLIRKWAYEAVMSKDGHFFDEGYFHYASDCDLALRIAACGIRGVQLDIPYWHYGSASLKLSPQRRGVELQADRDRAYFEKKWGFPCLSREYSEAPADLSFKGQRI